jgi:hypothetical protein
MDALVTGVILSGIVASIYWVKKLRKQEEQTEYEATHMTPHTEPVIEGKKSFLDRILKR